jgi:hypothetical protein
MAIGGAMLVAFRRKNAALVTVLYRLAPQRAGTRRIDGRDGIMLFASWQPSTREDNACFSVSDDATK